MASSQDDQELTAEEAAKASKFYTILFLISVSAAGWIWWNNNMQECRKSEFCIPVNQEWRLTSTGHYSSVNGLSNVFDLKGEIELSSGDIVPVEVSPFENDDWSQSIEVSSLSVKGVSVTDYLDPISLHLSFAVPNLTESVGQLATIRFTGQVTLPIMEEGDDVVSRSLGMDTSFIEEVKPVSDEAEIRLKPEGYEVPGRIARGWFWLSVIASVLTLLVVIGSRMDDPEDADG